MTRIALIAAMGHKRVIGANNRLCWHLAPDLKRFKAMTMDKPMIMGRKTFESLPGLLPGRLHIVISHTSQPDQEWVKYVSSVDEAVRFATQENAEEAMVIGGAQIYGLFLPLAHTVHLTEVDIDVPEGDAFFPPMDEDWALEAEDGPLTDEKSGLSYTYKTYGRVPKTGL